MHIDRGRQHLRAPPVAVLGELPGACVAGVHSAAGAAASRSALGYSALCLFRPLALARVRGEALRGRCAVRRRRCGRLLFDLSHDARQTIAGLYAARADCHFRLLPWLFFDGRRVDSAAAGGVARTPAGNLSGLWTAGSRGVRLVCAADARAGAGAALRRHDIMLGAALPTVASAADRARLDAVLNARYRALLLQTVWSVPERSCPDRSVCPLAARAAGAARAPNAAVGPGSRRGLLARLSVRRRPRRGICCPSARVTDRSRGAAYFGLAPADAI